MDAKLDFSPLNGIQLSGGAALPTAKGVEQQRGNRRRSSQGTSDARISWEDERQQTQKAEFESMLGHYQMQKMAK